MIADKLINLYSPCDGEVVVWHKKPGDYVKRDESIVDIESSKEKTVYEVPYTTDGILREIVAPVGTTVTANQIIGTFAVPGLKTKLKKILKRKQ